MNVCAVDDCDGPCLPNLEYCLMHRKNKPVRVPPRPIVIQGASLNKKSISVGSIKSSQNEIAKEEFIWNEFIISLVISWFSMLFMIAFTFSTGPIGCSLFYFSCLLIVIKLDSKEISWGVFVGVVITPIALILFLASIIN